ncbi:alkyl sulfatase dimerization domain-containing protein [Microbacterium awajiense]|uniref:Alkyl sulfatase dimerization domain-containing protein n=1 Tax=Microbacterium awajiense TaxID=415214 RepID=A0ABP7AWB8_9MICO
MPPKDATAAVRESNSAVRDALPFDDTTDFDLADRGFIATLDDGAIRNASGDVVWDAAGYGFVTGDAPDTVNPSLWRQSTLVSKHGLYEVVEGIYQVRGFDLSNITFVESDNGVIVIDPLISEETAAAALALYRAHRGDRKVVAVIFSHSHIDHFGGVLGVTSQADVDSGAVQIIAPDGFLEHAIEENVYAGTAMGRRAGYMYGAKLPRGPKGQVGAGLGQTTSTGVAGILVPTLTITTTGESHTIDGVEIEFQMAPGTEAPSEMHFYFPAWRALCIAENATHTMHNILTLRGAVVRDPRIWSHYLNEAIELYGDRSDVIFSPHHWPTWGGDGVVELLSNTRDLYSYIHDQTLRLLNKGLTGTEIAEQITLPPALEHTWSARGYYGSLSHNVKAVYQRYMGWFDGNPARLWPHPPAALAERYVAAMGGIDAVVGLAQTAFDAGDFRWAATLLDHAIFVQTDHAAARELYADTLEQLGYQAENGTWRNFFLSGAYELREGNFGTPTATNAPTILAELSPEQVFDALAITIDAPRAWDLASITDVTISDLGRSFRLRLRNGVLTYIEREPADGADLTIRLTKQRLLQLAAGDTSTDGIEVEGDFSALADLFSVLDPGDPNFGIVEPLP